MWWIIDQLGAVGKGLNPIQMYSLKNDNKKLQSCI